MSELNIELKVKLPFKMIKRKDWYVAICPAFDVASQGETEAKAKKNLIEALSAFLITCIECGTLNAVLQDCGFKPSLKYAKKNPVNIASSDYINIPIHLLTSQSCQDRCHV